jgi:hypothetical protein
VARTNLTDYLQVYPFWLMDVAPIEPLALPIFTPLLGFSAITSPEMTLETVDIAEANWFFSRKVVKSANASAVTLSRAASWYDSDFYKWTMAALTGDTGGSSEGGLLGSALSSSVAIGGATPRRDLLLIQFLSRSPLPSPAIEIASVAGTLGIQGAATAITSATGGIGGALASVGTVGTAALLTATVAAGGTLGPVEFAPRLPAKAWILYGCLPTRYKAGGDFDASSGAVSIQELEVAVEHWDELSLGSEVAPLAIAAGALL